MVELQESDSNPVLNIEAEYSRVSETLNGLSLRNRLHKHSRYGLFAFLLDRSQNHSVVDPTLPTDV